MNAQLILENGKRFSGKMFGAVKNVVGEVVFTTGMVGYQETLTDPSFAGQIVAMTFPLIGNYGINFEDMEAERVSLTAFIVREKCDYPSNFRTEMTLDAFLKQQGVVGLEGIDTRELTRTLRDFGCMKGVIMQGEPTDDEVNKLMATLDNSDVVMKNTTKEKYTVNAGATKKAAVIDMGAKSSVISNLTDRDFSVSVFPANTSAKEILAQNPDLVFVSNGPGNPLDAMQTVETVKELIGKVYVTGVCMGHQIIGLALGAKIEKLKFGHHGANQPVKDLTNGNVFITSQNHNYIVTDLPKNVCQTFINVNDGTCEGLENKTLGVKSVQFNPNATDVIDIGYLFDRV